MIHHRSHWILMASAIAVLRVVAQASEESPASPSIHLCPHHSERNPAISVVFDGFYHADDTEEGIAHLVSELSGFGRSHHVAGSDEHSHDPSPRQGFNLRPVEIVGSMAVKPYARGIVYVAASEEHVELEEAWLETLTLPLGLKFKGGKFLSDIGYLNAQHPHAWDFADQPLVYRLLFGEHGLNDTGVQLSWQAPTPWHLRLGAEAFQGDIKAFPYEGEVPLPRHDAPRIGAGWLKLSPPWPGPHMMQVGAFGVIGRHQEHIVDPEHETTEGRDGHGVIWGADLVYQYDAAHPHGEGDFLCQAEYARRHRDLDIFADPSNVVPAGQSFESTQDGYYVQVVYGFLPRWRVGLRWEQVGLTNRESTSNAERESWDASWKASAMVDFTVNHFARLRAQISRGRYELEDHTENANEVYLQAIFSFGRHGEHGL